MIPNELPNAVAAIVDQHRALAVLRLLVGPLNGATNDALLSDLLDSWGLGSARSTLLACIRQLERSGLVITTMNGDRTVLRLTLSGEEAAEGKVQVPGVLHFKAVCPY